jgi:hypothetical protein
MENGKKSINPITENTLLGLQGLTKREYFASLMLKGILSNPNIANLSLNPTESMKDSVMVEYSIRMTNELLKQLEDGNN